MIKVIRKQKQNLSRLWEEKFAVREQQFAF